MANTVLGFDKLNKLGRRVVEIPYEVYFGEMEIPEEDVKKRIVLAEMIEDAALFLFAYYIAAKQYGTAPDRNVAETAYKDSLREALESANVREEVIRNYLDGVADEELNVTQKRYMEDDYWTSSDRAKTIGSNDANIVLNEQDYMDAVSNGKRHHQWITMRDERVRKTHQEVDSRILPIDEPFVVGNSLMMFPGDTSLGADASEIVNCRCSIRYF